MRKEYLAMTRKGVMSRYFATGLVITLATPALAFSSSTYYLGLDRITHTCFVRTAPLKPGIKLMGIYKSFASAEKAMRDMKECEASAGTLPRR